MDEIGAMDNTRKRHLTGQVAIITGGTSGIGRASCLALAKQGASVVVVGRNPKHVGRIVEEIERQPKGMSSTLGLELDVCQERDMEKMVSQTLQTFGRIDILIAGAGTLRGSGRWPRQLTEMSTEEWDEVLDTNLKGVFLSNRAVLPTMIRQREGNVINISSTSGLKGLAYDSAYCASKFGVIGLSEAVAKEVRQYGVRVQVLLPGAVNTPMWKENDPIPHPNSALPVERIADVILYLLTVPYSAVLIGARVIPFEMSNWSLEHRCRSSVMAKSNPRS
jgi:3-oxoacyl-[acyl-carrier protein] reductase